MSLTFAVLQSSRYTYVPGTKYRLESLSCRNINSLPRKNMEDSAAIITDSQTVFYSTSSPAIWEHSSATWYMGTVEHHFKFLRYRRYKNNWFSVVPENRSGTREKTCHLHRNLTKRQEKTWWKDAATNKKSEDLNILPLEPIWKSGDWFQEHIHEENPSSARWMVVQIQY